MNRPDLCRVPLHAAVVHKRFGFRLIGPVVRLPCSGNASAAGIWVRKSKRSPGRLLQAAARLCSDLQSDGSENVAG